MRFVRVIALVVGLALVPLPLAHATFAAAASSLFEALPFLLAASLPAAARRPWALALLGCGCAGGPAARSLPAALLGMAVLGPWIGALRCLAAWSLHRPAGRRAEHLPADPLAALESYLPYALAGAAALCIFPGLVPELAGIPWPLAILAGALLAFLVAPCAFGAIALGAALEHIQPALACGWLAVAGIADLRTFTRVLERHERAGKAAAFASAAALAVVVLRNGAMLINPRYMPLLALSAVALIWTGRARAPTLRGLSLACFLLAAAVLVQAPERPPPASASTLSSAYAGQTFAMIGQVARSGGATFVTRQAITCCRADAAPVTIRTQCALNRAPGAWVEVRGVLVQEAGTLRLSVRALHDISTPRDPFLYR